METSPNPLLQRSSLKYEAVPFASIHTEHFLPALEAAIAEARQNIEALKANSSAASFSNTIVALEEATSRPYDVAYIYSNLKSAHGDHAMHALAKEIMPKLIKLESDINLDAQIFARVKAVHRTLGTDESLSVEQRMLLEKTYRSFLRNGGNLPPEGKLKLRHIDEELSTLGPSFSENVLKATNSYEMVIVDRNELKGLPDSAIEAAAQTALEKGLNKVHGEAWVFNLQALSVTAFLRYAENRERRRELWMAWSSRALEGPYSNKALAKRMATLRHERATLLGFASHAHFQMDERMAVHPDKVRAFLEQLQKQSRPAADRELADLKAYKKAAVGDDDLQQWDYAFWANKLKEERYTLKSEELRPYFKLENVLAGAFEHARRLYDLVFEPLSGLPVYQKDVQVYEVKNAVDGTFVGLFYGDFFPSELKAGGAWATRFKPQWRRDGVDHRPHVSIVCNFTKPTATKPSLLTFQEVNTLFHEFGHALHSLLSRCAYRSLSCTNVYRDFVELPSQIMENWIKEKESLALFATHYRTGELIPDHLVERIKASESFHAGFAMMRQLRFALLDLAWHGQDPSLVQDIQAFEASAVESTTLLPNVPGTNISCSFEHIFSGGYSAGYYGYKWAEVLDADAFEYFQQKGIFSREVADLFRTQILEKGGTEHPMELYKRFRGREPDAKALLRRSQLL